MKNEELRTKNWGCFGVALQPSTLAGEPKNSMRNHKNTGNPSEIRGFARASGANLMCCSYGDYGDAAIEKCCSCGDDNNAAIHSSFFILHS